jgi:hypothetical protein
MRGNPYSITGQSRDPGTGLAGPRQELFPEPVQSRGRPDPAPLAVSFARGRFRARRLARGRVLVLGSAALAGATRPRPRPGPGPGQPMRWGPLGLGNRTGRCGLPSEKPGFRDCGLPVRGQALQCVLASALIHKRQGSTWAPSRNSGGARTSHEGSQGNGLAIAVSGPRLPGGGAPRPHTKPP